MNYGDAYPSALQQMSPPRVLISDHSSGIPLAIGPYHSPTSLPYIPMMPIGTTTIPCTTPASVLPPSPPPVLTTQLPHVFISDHSEVPAPSDSRTLPQTDANIRVPSGVLPSETKSVTIALRRASEPSEVLSSSFAQTQADSESRSKSRPTLQRYQSTTPTSNQWLKRVVVLLICALVVGLAFKIGVELWKASYGESNSASQVV
ncbi:hypothetical protein GE061_002215 [Apolygus lucorum]|uniref:Uncharacterized protein n=1 Tax=Apolygus lucorum TaxID=248454 RepID=A0A6A4J836_APOLU|nr:hypothetical protein GE061_002215 [Apolygus lucorum]